MKKFIFLLANLVSFLAVCGIGNTKTQNVQDAKQPNIIFILVDDMGYGDVGVLFQNQLGSSHNNKVPVQFTPQLDLLANDGVLLTQQYCAAPVCAPSRASLMSGRSQGHVNVRNNQFDKALEDNYTLGNILQKAGYSTAAFGKWGLQGRDTENIPNWPAHPLNRGFDYFLGYIRHGDGHEHYPKEGLYRGVKEVWENRTNIAPALDKCYTADLWTAAAKKWITDHEKGEEADKPFFVFLAYDTPHAVLELPTQAYPNGGGLNGGLQWLGKPGQMINTASGVIDSWIHPDYVNATYDNDHNPATPEVAWPDVYKRYATDTRRIDDAIGDIRKLLQDLKIDKNTMVVFTSDNGPSQESYLKEAYHPTFFKSFGPFDGIKRDCWEGGVRMPALAVWPGNFPEGSVVKAPSINYDWLATLANVAGTPAPAVSDGVSLMPSLTGKGEQQQSNIYIEYFQNGITPKYDDFLPEHQGRKRGEMQMLRLGDYVGVRYNIQFPNDDFEIYNILDDPQQSNNLATNRDMDSLQKQFKEKALQSRRTNDSAIRPYDTELVPAVSGLEEEPGLKWSKYSGDFLWVPQVYGLKADESGFSDKPSPKLENKESAAMLFEGFVKVPDDGIYSFYLTANSKAVLKIHDATVIDADYGYFNNEPCSGEIRLAAGLHPIRLYFLYNGKGKPNIKLEWTKMGIPEEIPSAAFFH